MELKVHPLFLLYGVAMTMLGQFLPFVSVTLVTLLHEMGHSLYAAHVGFRLKTVRLLPFGAIVSGEKMLLSKKEEVFLFLAGPLTNFLLCIFFLALWWLFPETYPYTEIAMTSSLAVGTVNLLPAMPLDGGRVLFCLIGRKKLPMAVLTVCTAVALFALSVLSKNISLAFFALFLLPPYRGESYERISYEKGEGHGLEVRLVRVDKDAPILRAYRFLDEKHYLVLIVTDGDETIGEIGEKELLRMFETCENSVHFGDLCDKNERKTCHFRPRVI